MPHLDGAAEVLVLNETATIAEQWAAVPAVLTQLERCRRLTGVELPTPSQHGVRQNPRGPATAMADRLSPMEASTSSPSIGRP